MHVTFTHTSDERKATGANIASKVGIKGHVRIENGDTVIEGHNKICSPLLWNLCNHISCNTMIDQWGMMYDWANREAIYLGTDTTTPTTPSTTALVSPIGSGNGTRDSTRNAAAFTTGPSSDIYNYMYTGTWAPGTVSGTVGEMALYMATDSTPRGAGAQAYEIGSYIVARFAVADGEFTAFTIDNTKTLTISWTISFHRDDSILFNKFVMNLAECLTATTYTISRNLPSYNWGGKSSFLYLGSDTTTPNDPNMSDLAAPIAVKATTQTYTTKSPQAGTYKVNYTAVWAAGTISGTVGEIGLYLFGGNTYGVGATNWYQGPYLQARMSAADGHFSSWEINTSENFTITWTIVFEFDDT